MNKAKITEILIKVILCVIVLKFVVKWENGKIAFMMLAALITVYVIWPLLVKTFKKFNKND
ncbi:hypothetical protein [Abyssisolibacter fermentans]|uniref:hypothetical protein n=1 Tax=Abyssisolibacter fermentans TaxID=1766203 RepID=UPI000835CA66|nr:hypothetical protein [Abyssisolibacter fermentans]